MASSCLGDRKQVQDARFDNHLTGDKKESFIGSRKQIRHVEKVYLVKTKSA